MYGKKVFATLVALFCLFGLSGCGGGGGGGDDSDAGGSVRSDGGLSINEGSYFPEFSGSAVKIVHSIERYYANQSERDSIVRDFKIRYPRSTTLYGLTVIDNPLNDGNIIKASILPENIGYPIAIMSIEVNGTRNIERNDELFKAIFGDTDAPIVLVSVDKYFASNIASQLNNYGKYLENFGFRSIVSGVWQLIESNIVFVRRFINSGTLAEWEVSTTAPMTGNLIP
ncbi:MAG: hypothetical protein LBS39_02135 [Campylobacteraceae bacterium]|jgi:hypothetical protein|nr:hypothetical protein [Campylobacteraceae bacterium]